MTCPIPDLPETRGLVLSDGVQSSIDKNLSVPFFVISESPRLAAPSMPMIAPAVSNPLISAGLIKFKGVMGSSLTLVHRRSDLASLCSLSQC